MTEILDRIAKADHHFRPQTGLEFFALQLARKLDDIAQVRMYLNLAEHHSQPVLLHAFRNVTQSGVAPSAKSFSSELKRLAEERP